MRQELSILIPTYNCYCTDLVKSLHWQLGQLDVSYEIIVADDGSPDKSFIERNKAIEALGGVNYIICPQNMGRAAIRNFLAGQAQHEWLLFIDGDVMVEHAWFVERYLKTPGQVVMGGIQVHRRNRNWLNNLRFLYETASEEKHKASQRRKHPEKAFRTTSFLVEHDIIDEHPFDEQFRHYGYEDVLFGKHIHESGIAIQHIDNPVTLTELEDNPTFMAKTEESLRTLHTFRKELRGYSTLLNYSFARPLLKPLYHIIGKTIRKNLAGNNPRLSLFNIYKLLYYSSL